MNDVTRWFLDTEFNEDGKTIELISIAHKWPERFAWGERIALEMGK